jgi:6-phosphogluconolactonase
MRELVLCETPDDVADAAADLIFESQTEAILERGIFRIALCGGQTPGRLYHRLATDEWKDTMSWEQWEVFWSDERAVPLDNPDSNYYIARRAFLDKVPIGDIWPMHADPEHLSESAADYARLLKSRFGGALPVFDTILLGMGSDGHTASLFPGHPAMKSDSIVEAVETSQKPSRRLTLTLPVLNHARRILFQVTGVEKAGSLHEILEAKNETLPAARVNPEEGECWWIFDHAAAGR